MTAPARKVVVALRMAGIAGQDKLNGIFEHLSAGHRWQMTLYRTQREFTRAVVRRHLADGTDGFIVALPDADDALGELARASVPTVVMNVSGGGIERRRANIAFVRSDAAEVGREAAAELLRQGGYRSYGYVGYAGAPDWSVARGKAFAERLARDGIRTSFHGHRQSLGDWLAKLEKPCAVFASCDDDAYTVLDVCRSLNLAVPSAVAVLGVNNDPILCENSEPRLSSIQPGFVQEGRLAAELLEQIMARSARTRSADGAEAVPFRRHHLVGIRGIVRRDSTLPDSISGMLVQKALAYIERQALSGISVGDVARHLKVSRPLLDLRFREHLAESVYTLILRIRLEEVKRRLRLTDERIAQIAAACGWKNPASLQATFKRLVGVSLSDWRRRQTM